MQPGYGNMLRLRSSWPKNLWRPMSGTMYWSQRGIRLEAAGGASTDASRTGCQSIQVMFLVEVYQHPKNNGCREQERFMRMADLRRSM